MELSEILKQSKLEGEILRLPDIKLDRKEYLTLANKLQSIGGKWKGGKIQGFVFDNDPTENIELLIGNNNHNPIKEFQFFPTPDDLADEMINHLNEMVVINCTILEPSAGQGSLINALLKKYPNTKTIHYCEIMETNRNILDQKFPDRLHFVCEDFLKIDYEMLLEEVSDYDIIIANPPFSKNRDIDHIHKMYDLLSEYGILVTLASRHWESCNNKKETEFREWLKEVNAEIIPIKEGRFKESGTSIATNMIIIKNKK